MESKLVGDAVVAIIRRGTRLLIVKRGPAAVMPGYWCPPSGRVEPAETQEAAIVREIREELGVGATPLEKVWECPTHDGTFLLHWWTVSFPSDDLVLDPAEVAEARWVTAREFLELKPTFDGDRYFFSEVLPTLRSNSATRDHNEL